VKLFLLSQDENNNYDTYDSVVVCADTEDEARLIHPDKPYRQNPWVNPYSSWCKTPKAVTVKYIGEAAPHVKPGVVLGSFNAG
jgi:hypothetical protein